MFEIIRAYVGSKCLVIAELSIWGCNNSGLILDEMSEVQDGKFLGCWKMEYRQWNYRVMNRKDNGTMHPRNYKSE